MTLTVSVDQVGKVLKQLIVEGLQFTAVTSNDVVIITFNGGY